VLPVLKARQALLDRVPALVEEGADGYYHALAPARAHELLRQRLFDFQAEYPARDWQSRTGATEQAYQALGSSGQ